ncbi:MAG TPA: hypothetical protein VFA59_01875 [Vicinamibacterales bacterium]|nr:hypothetical protein [Vicinamibacterales bacterium]
MLDNELDRAIDDAAREMTAGGPGGDFRARVIARIENAPRRRWTRAIPAVAAAAAVAIVATVTSHRSAVISHRSAVTSQSQQSTVAHGQTPVVETRPTPQPTNVAQAFRPAAADLRSRPTSGRQTPRPLTPSDLDNAPIDVPQITVDPLPPDGSLDVTPLETIAPIAVTPIDAQGDRP